MKISKLLSVFLFGFLVTGFVHAQEAEAEVEVLADPVVEEVAPEPVLLDAEPAPMMQDMMRSHGGFENMSMEECPMHKMMMGKMGGDCDGGCMRGMKGGDCPMKKMMSAHHGEGGILFKILHCVGMLLCLFLATFVIRKGWMLGGKSCCLCKSSCGKTKK